MVQPGIILLVTDVDVFFIDLVICLCPTVFQLFPWSLYPLTSTQFPRTQNIGDIVDAGHFLAIEGMVETLIVGDDELELSNLANSLEHP